MMFINKRFKKNNGDGKSFTNSFKSSMLYDYQIFGIKYLGKK